ncbi:hypothetical protein PsorP6_007673 [Peronosclerospora sorghi]|uniref:Uncharacterized protein n=1 Tax=Peronosclerospora sorghi TaxID=230839 RepID=A0ACC0WD64_9STRA|nr:hypothetical protein PsorP6_007673 [Peronosclerospora sorghi]
MDEQNAHLENQHPNKWEEYNQSSKEERELFFNGHPFKSTMHAHFAGTQTALHFSVNQDIVDVHIGEMLFDTDAYEEVASSRERALAAFVELSASADEMEDSNGEDQTHRYGIKACCLVI